MENNSFRTVWGGRDSSIELFRIVTMLCIVAHHYVVNSGILDEILPSNALVGNSLFELIFGWGGKTGINCFVLITGYFMCKSEITVKKFLKLLLEIEFYNIVFYLIFLLSGYSDFSLKVLIKTVIPVYALGTDFNASYLVFFLFIPFLNLLIRSMDEQMHRRLVILCIVVGTILQTFLMAPAAFTYVGWFMVLYFIASYIRLYPKAIFGNKKICGLAALVSLLLSWGSVVTGAWVYSKWGYQLYYFFVADSNKLLAVVTAVCAFLFFKNLHLRYHPAINRIAASAFGVLLIHANSDTMRQWLWRDMLDNVHAFHSSYFWIHAIVSVLVIYLVCTLLDMIRIRFIEQPFFAWWEKHRLAGKNQS